MHCAQANIKTACATLWQDFSHQYPDVLSRILLQGIAVSQQVFQQLSQSKESFKLTEFLSLFSQIAIIYHTK